MKTINEDRKDIIETAFSLGFKGKRFLITGATGMIGQNLVSALELITDAKNIIVFGKDLDESERVFASRGVVCSSFEHLQEIEGNVDYIVHLASPTNSQFMSNNPVETIDFMYSSTKTILDFALKHNSKVLYASSMEVFGEVLDEHKKGEQNLGYISLCSTRSSYSEVKRLCELLCFCYAKEFKLNVYIARLSQTFGAGTSIDDPRIFGYIARCVKNSQDIVLKTKGDSVGNYCYLSDTIRSFFYILANGQNGETYNVVGDDNRSTIYDMACLVADKITDKKIKVLVEIDNNGNYPNATKLNMSNEKIKNIGWQPKYNLLDMFKRMIG